MVFGAVLWVQLRFLQKVDFFRSGVSAGKGCKKTAWENLES